MDSEKRKNRPIPKGRARKQDNDPREARPTDRPETDQGPVGLRPDLESLRRETQERERAEAALKRTEREYRHLVESAHDAILIFRPEDEVVLEVNQRACELYGFTREEFIGMSLEKITHDVPRGKVQIQATLDQGFYHHFESVHYRKDGSEMFVEINGSRVNYQGQWAIQSINRDITERKDLEEALQFTRVSIDNANDTMVCVDRDARFIDVNSAFCRGVGYSREELLSMTVHDIDPDYHAEMWPEFWERMKQAGSLTFESRHRAKDGRIIPVEIVATFFEHNGKEYHCSFARDITERQRIEEALRRKEEDYRTLAENSPDLIARFDRQLRHTYVNPAAARAGRLSASEYIGKTIPESGVPEPTAGRWEERIRQVLETSQLMEVVDVFPTPDGTRYFNTRFIPELAPDGSVQSVLSVARDITERKRAEETLRRSEERFRALTENSSDVVIVVDKKGIITYVSPSIERVMGYKPEELIGESGFNFIALADLPRAVIDFGKAVLINESIIPNAFHVRHKDGSERILEGVGRSLFDNSAIEGFVMNVRDITERKRVEEALRDSEEKYRLLVENSQQGILVLQDGKIQFANPRVVQHSGYSLLELTSRPFLKLIHPEDRAMVAERYEKRLKDKAIPEIYQFRFIDKQGRDQWVEVNSVRITWKGRPAALSFLSDITERKRAEEHVSYQASLLANVHDAVISFDEDFKVTSWNQAAEEMYGWKAEEVIGRTRHEVLHTEYVGTKRDEAIQTLKETGQFQGELIQQHRGGQRIYAETKAVALKDASGRITGYVSVNRDITERKRAEEALRESEAHYRLLAENVTDVIWTLDLNLRFTYVSPSVRRLRGYSVEEAKDLSLKETLTPASFEKAIQAFSEEMALEGSGRGDPHRSRTLDLENLCKDDSAIWTEVTTTFLRDPTGRPVGILGVTRDISDRRKVEKALRENEAMSRAVLEHSPVGISIRDHQGVLLQVNEAWKKIWAISDAEIQENEKWSAGRSWKERCPYLGDSGQDVDRLFTPEGGVSILYLPEVEIPEPRPGAANWISLYLYALRNEAGQVEKVVTLTQDISERTRADGALKESEEKYRLVVEHARDAILVAQDGMMKFVNHRVQEITGYSEGELTSRSFHEFIHSEDRAMVVQRHQSRLQGKPVPQAYPFRIVTKAGEDCWVEIRAVTIPWQGKPATLNFLTDITEHRKAEEALRKSEAKYRELVENANSIILRRDPEGRITFFNEFAQRFFGYREGEILGGNVVGTIVPEKESSGRDLVQMIRDISRHPERYATNENENVLRNGERVWISWTNKPILDPDGKLAEILCIGNDITGRKRAEERLAESEVKYRTLVEGMSEAVMQVDNDDRVQFANPQFCQMIGYREDELMGRVGYEIYFDPEEQELIRRKNRLRLEKASDAYETRMRKKTGEEVLVRISGSPVTDPQGNVVGSIGVITDITERKRAEQAVKESETKYRGIVDHALLGIYITQSHIMKFCNQRLAEIFGYEKPEELIGTHVRELVAPESWEAVDTQVQRRESGELDTVRYEFKGRRRDGALIDLEVLGGRILYEGKPAIQGSMIEVTERKLLEAEFLQAQKMEALGRLAGGVAHDFNNLLTSIMGYSDLLAKKLTEDDPSGPLRRYADNILSSANRAANLTQQLLSLSRRHAFHMQILDLNGVVAEVERILRGLIGEDIELTIHADGALGRVKADSVQIEQVLMNLAINARDAMPHGGRLSIRTANIVLDKSYAQRRREVAPGPYVMIAVTDTGQGMDAEVQSHLFEPFFTTKEKGKGTGLGLSTAYGIVKQTGGHIDVESASGKGSAFKIYLPRTEEIPVPLSSSQPQPVEAELPRGVETVLVAEDEETVRSFARDVLRGAGYTVLEAGDGEEALRVAGSHPGPIHLLLTDVIMPRLGGPALARHLQPLRPDMKILFMSGYTDGDISSYGGLGSETALLQKPFQPMVLARRVREALEAP